MHTRQKIFLKKIPNKPFSAQFTQLKDQLWYYYVCDFQVVSLKPTVFSVC